MARYGKKAQQKVKQALHERKRGSLRSGRSGRKVKSRKQAIAIGLSQARRAGAKVPPPKRSAAGRKARKRPAKKLTRQQTARKTSSKRTGKSPRKSASRKK
jgi:hypothetical protein